VVSWQLYSKENLSPSGGDPVLFRMKPFEAALDANFSHPVLLTEVSSRFLSSERCLQHMNSFFSFHLQVYALELHCPLAEDKSFIMVDLALLLRLHIIFIGTFVSLQARIRAFSSLLIYFQGMLKWYFQKQTPH